jgi:hypothetical protein
MTTAHLGSVGFSAQTVTGPVRPPLFLSLLFHKYTDAGGATFLNSLYIPTFYRPLGIYIRFITTFRRCHTSILWN